MEYNQIYDLHGQAYFFLRTCYQLAMFIGMHDIAFLFFQETILNHKPLCFWGNVLFCLKWFYSLCEDFVCMSKTSTIMFRQKQLDQLHNHLRYKAVANLASHFFRPFLIEKKHMSVCLSVRLSQFCRTFAHCLFLPCLD